MPDPLLHNGTAGPSVDTAPDGPDTEATAPPLKKPLKKPLTHLGSDDAAVCTDGVCVL